MLKTIKLKEHIVMKKTFVLLGLLALSVFSFAAGEGDMKIYAKVNIYSGRGPIAWEMSGGEIEQLKAKLAGLGSTDEAKLPEWGYVLIENQNPASAFPYKKIYVYNKIIAAETETGMKYYKDTSGIMEMMADLGNKHDPSYVPPKSQTLPPNTAYIVVIPTSFGGTVDQGAAVKKTLTIFSEGSGPLRGTVMAPYFMSVDKSEFELKAVEDIEDFIFSVDTTKAGQLNGEIIVNSNDPENYEIKIPVAFNVEAAGELTTPVATSSIETSTTQPETATSSTLPSTPANGDYMQYLPYAAGLIILLLIASVLYKRSQDDKLQKQREEFESWKKEQDKAKK